MTDQSVADQTAPSEVTGESRPSSAATDQDGGAVDVFQVDGAAAERLAGARVLSQVALVTRAQDGDAGAYEQLVLAYQGELVRLGYRLLSDVGEAQDAVQDTLVLAWRKLPTLTDPQAFRAWVYQLMTRRCLNLLRARGRRRTSLSAQGDLGATEGGTLAADPAQGPAQQVQVSALQEGLTSALAALPADLRACWVLHELHDLSYPEIGFAIGVPVSTVRGRIARGRQQLAKGMTQWR